MSNDLSLEILNSSFTEASLALPTVLIFVYRLSPAIRSISPSRKTCQSPPVNPIYQALPLQMYLLPLTFFKLKSTIFLDAVIEFGPDERYVENIFGKFSRTGELVWKKSRNLRNCKNTFVSNIHCGAVEFYKMRYFQN